MPYSDSFMDRHWTSPVAGDPENSLACEEPRLVTIPAGEFLMGCDSGQDNERPIHQISLDAILLAMCQVTNAEFARFVEDTGAAPPPFWKAANFDHPCQPVVAVSW